MLRCRNRTVATCSDVEVTVKSIKSCIFHGPLFMTPNDSWLVCSCWIGCTHWTCPCLLSCHVICVYPCSYFHSQYKPVTVSIPSVFSYGVPGLSLPMYCTVYDPPLHTSGVYQTYGVAISCPLAQSPAPSNHNH